jgi:hypothetical protein
MIFYKKTGGKNAVLFLLGWNWGKTYFFTSNYNKTKNLDFRIKSRLFVWRTVKDLNPQPSDP